MAYTKQTWTDGQTVYASQLNHIEDGIEAVEAEIPTDAYEKPSTGIPATDLAQAVQTSLEKADNAIPAPSSPATGAFLVWNGSAWVAQTLATWSGGSY